MKEVYKCPVCKHEYQKSEVRESFCPKCMVPMKREIKDDPNVTQTSENVTFRPEGDNGLGILILDLSYSMNLPAFSKESKDFPQTKMEVVIKAMEYAFKELLAKSGGISEKENAYICIIGFAKSAHLLLFKPIKYFESFDWYSFITKKRDELVNKDEEELKSTNIIGALQMARSIYDKALSGGDLKEYEIDTFEPIYHVYNLKSATKKTMTINIANIRVFLYSDGEHNVSGTLDENSNPFLNASILQNTSLKTNVTGLICGFFGDVEDPINEQAWKSLGSISGTCPIHGDRGVFNINKFDDFHLIKKIFHMASAASGFCGECAEQF